MIGSSGWAGVVKNSVESVKSTNGMEDSFSSPISFALVHQLTDNLTGTIICGTVASKSLLTARPLNTNIKNYPIAGEMVILIQVPKVDALFKDGYGPFEDDSFIFYLNNVNIWNNPSLNALIDSTQLNTPQSKDYFSPLKIQNIIPLLPLPGDIIYEGRFGNSIRLGNTNNSYLNNWSSNGEKGDPITIISNGQSSENISNLENINEDLSSIYLTSYQKIANFKIANNSFSSYNKKDKPILPSEYLSSQVILNSDRIVLNAKTDSIIISGENSVGISSNKSININSKEFYIDSIDIKIGSPNASEPALLGNETVDLLIRLTKQVQKLGKIASTSQLWPGGIPTPDAGSNTIGNNINMICENLLSKLNDNKRGIKSNFVKIR